MATRLRDAVSPYLRSHADNPVDWWPWGDAAFAAAAERDVPVFISIGYATCHWCHVMARESFSDDDIAETLNGGFVAIKVDREEHPDVDATYLSAASAFTPHLGWPLTVFARPDGRAFYAGTYFPPRAGGGTPAFRDVLGAVELAWRERRNEVDVTANAIGEALAAASARLMEPRTVTRADLDDAVATLASQEDPEFGGFGGAPKFPIAPVLGFLAESRPAGRALAARTMERMSASPLRDPVEGGFFRYATGADWSDPHYERMLTDNALLLDVCTRLSDDAPALRGVAVGLIEFLTGVLQLPSGAFASAQDSESIIDGRRDEGGYYRRAAAERVALEPPPLDEKVLTGWNGLAISALARAAFRFDDPFALAAARSAADAVRASHIDGRDRLARASRDGRVSAAHAALEDIGMFACGLLDLALVDGNVEDAVLARDLVDAAMAAAGLGVEPTTEPRLLDAGLPFAAPDGADPVLSAHGITAPTDPAEGAVPSGLTACAAAAWRLYLLGAGAQYREAAERCMRLIAGSAIEHPLQFGGALELMARMSAPEVQLVTVLPTGVDGDANALAAATRRQPASVSVIVDEATSRAFAEAGFTLFEGRSAGPNGLAYRCVEFVCALPVAEGDALDRLGRADA